MGNSSEIVPVHEMVRQRAALQPDAVAVRRGSEYLTYGELDARANQLAHWLQAHGAAPERCVAVLMERSVEMLLAFLAVFKSGALAVLLDPAHPLARRRQVLAAAHPVVALTLARLGTTSGHDCPTIAVDADWPRIHGQSAAPPEVAVHPDNLAYVVHTSGSTGEPKRVAVTHRSVAHSIGTHRDGHRFTPDDRCAWLSPPGSSASVGELWPPLTAGAALQVIEPDDAASAAGLRDALVATGVTTAFVSMPLAEQLFFLEWPAGTALRLMTVGSDRVRRWASAALPFEVAVSCGSAEANGITSGLVPWGDRLTSATAGPADRAVAPPIGRPWPDVRIALHDADLRPVSDGTPGEMYVSGPELARGYLGDAAQTAARFLPDPDGPPGSRMYRTGDLGLRRPDGRFEHHGRVDHEVKIRGQRVDPAEVETHLLDQPDVREAVVVPADHPSGERQLVAYLVTGAPPQPERLRAALAARLADHAVPTAYQRLDRLPLTVNGKVDRAALPAPVWTAPPREHDLPRTDLERHIVEVWIRVLGVESVGRDDHFFRIGGTSLNGARVASHLSAELGRTVTVRALLRFPTPAKLARHLGGAPIGSVR